MSKSGGGEEKKKKKNPTSPAKYIKKSPGTTSQGQTTKIPNLDIFSRRVIPQLSLSYFELVFFQETTTRSQDALL